MKYLCHDIKEAYIISYHEALCHDMSYVTTIMASLLSTLDQGNHYYETGQRIISYLVSIFNGWLTGLFEAVWWYYTN